MQRDINKTWFFKHPKPDVWAYLTVPELLAQWLMNNDFKPEVGHQFKFTNGPQGACKSEGTAHCEVLEVMPHDRLVYSWKSGKDTSNFSVNSTVVWTLNEKNGGTELVLQHNGFSTEEDFANHDNGWNSCGNKFTAILNETSYATLQS